MVPAGDAAMVALTGNDGLTIIEIALETAGLPLTQVAFELSEQVTRSPLLSVLEVKVALFAPAAIPLTNHA